MIPSDWTVDTLKEHFESRFTAQEKALDAALAAQEKGTAAALASADRAVVKAETAANDRFNGVNEFRGQLADQVATFPSRSEVDAQFKALADRIDVTTTNHAALLGALAERVGAIEGKALGTSTLFGYLVGAAGFVAAVVGVVIAVVAG